MIDNYCYWSIATGKYSGTMRRCIQSGRRVGIFKHFVVFTDTPIDDCDCYEAVVFSEAGPCFKTAYLQAGMSRLAFDYLVWIDADSIFTRNPSQLMATLRQSPIHVPLERNPQNVGEDFRIGKMSFKGYESAMKSAGVYHDVYSSRSAFFIVRRTAIDYIVLLIKEFSEKCKTLGLEIDDNTALGYAMHMLCANPKMHTVSANPALWGEDHVGKFQSSYERLSDSTNLAALDAEGEVCPAILHVPYVVR